MAGRMVAQLLFGACLLVVVGATMSADLQIPLHRPTSEAGASLRKVNSATTSPDSNIFRLHPHRPTSDATASSDSNIFRVKLRPAARLLQVDSATISPGSNIVLDTPQHPSSEESDLTLLSDPNNIIRVPPHRSTSEIAENRENPLLHEFAADDFSTITNEVDEMPPLEGEGMEEEDPPCNSDRLRHILEQCISSSPRASLFAILRRVPHAQFGINCTRSDVRPQLRPRADFCQLTQDGTTCALAVGPLRPPYLFNFHLSEAQIFRPDSPNSSQDSRQETDVVSSKIFITRPKKQAVGVTPEAEELAELLATIGPEPIPSLKVRSEGEAR